MLACVAALDVEGVGEEVDGAVLLVDVGFPTRDFTVFVRLDDAVGVKAHLGAVYAHFGGKEELFLAVIQRQRQRFLDGFADAVSSSDRVDSTSTIWPIGGGS
jgi:hypothetical protein